MTFTSWQQRPYILPRVATNTVLGTAILLYGYKTPTLVILFSTLQSSSTDRDLVQTLINEITDIFNHLTSSFSRQKLLASSDLNSFAIDVYRRWQLAVESGDIERIQSLLRRLLTAVSSVVATHASPRLAVLSHGLVLGRQMGDLLFSLLQKTLTGANVHEAAMRVHNSTAVESPDQVLRTTADVVGTLAGICFSYIGGTIVNTYVSCAIGADLVSTAVLECAMALLVVPDTPPVDSTSSTNAASSTSTTGRFNFKWFFSKSHGNSTVHATVSKEVKSLIPRSTQMTIRQVLQSPVSALVLKSTLIAIGMARIPFHRTTYVENALLSPQLVLEQLLLTGLALVKDN